MKSVVNACFIEHFFKDARVQQLTYYKNLKRTKKDGKKFISAPVRGSIIMVPIHDFFIYFWCELWSHSKHKCVFVLTIYIFC